jgi:archaeal flagellin FlaB
MLKRILTQKRYLKNIYKEQKGITGLETAIILIAFVVVAAVFAYTVLSAGLFSTQKSQEAVYSGLQETQNTLVVKGGVLSQAESKATDNCDIQAAVWANGTDGTATLEATLIHEGAGSIKLTGDGTVAVDTTIGVSAGTIDVATSDTITFWAKLNNSGDANKFAFAVGAATTDLLTANTSDVVISAADTNWHLYSVDVAAGEAGTTDVYGVYAATGTVGAGIVYIDDLQVNNVSLWNSTKLWTPYSSSIIVTLSLATGGQPVDFSAGTDDTAPLGIYTSADNGGTKTNKLVINYNDAYQHVTDVGWTGTFIGNSNGDYMLDPGEKIKITVDLTYINTTTPVVDANHQFTLELKTPKGAVLSFERTMPARLYGIDNLN